MTSGDASERDNCDARMEKARWTSAHGPCGKLHFLCVSSILRFARNTTGSYPIYKYYLFRILYCSLWNTTLGYVNHKKTNDRIHPFYAICRARHDLITHNPDYSLPPVFYLSLRVYIKLSNSLPMPSPCKYPPPRRATQDSCAQNVL